MRRQRGDGAGVVRQRRALHEPCGRSGRKVRQTSSEASTGLPIASASSTLFCTPRAMPAGNAAARRCQIRTDVWYPPVTVTPSGAEPDDLPRRIAADQQQFEFGIIRPEVREHVFGEPADAVAVREIAQYADKDQKLAALQIVRDCEIAFGVKNRHRSVTRAGECRIRGDPLKQVEFVRGCEKSTPRLLRRGTLDLAQP